MLMRLDPTLKLPISDPAQAAYAARPLAERPASDFVVRGGTIYAGKMGGRRWWESELMWLPRVGVAWQFVPKTVLRAGYGLFFDTLNAMLNAPNQTNFSRSTSTVLTTDFGYNWLVGDPRRGISPLTDPFPVRSDGTRFDVPLRDALGEMSLAGRSLTWFPRNLRHARQQRWRRDWKDRLQRKPDMDLALPAGEMKPIGYVVWQHGVRLERPVRAYEKWIARIPGEYSRQVLGREDYEDVTMDGDPHRLALIKHYRSLMPMAQEARKPIFHLKPADGAIGSHAIAAQDVYGDFKQLAGAIASRAGIELSRDPV